ncbi:MAG TPA: sporulation integral membrane protein YtvI [Candidatus Faecousia intestinigallinarum]|nr:sporulation integral membrane protein YtvI [Candidatus Faecousia intestinigallinarum]
MSRPIVHKLAILAGVFGGVWLLLHFFLPLILPFLLGAALALAAEPVVALLTRRLHLPRGLSAAIGVSGVLVLLLGLILFLGSVVVRELGQLAQVVPDAEQMLRQGLLLLEDFLLSLANRAPDGIRALMTKTVLNLFGGSTALMDQAAQALPGLLTGMLGHIPGSALTLGTGILSAFMISARLPRLRAWLAGRLPQNWRQQYLPKLQKIRQAVLGWLKAQTKLLFTTFCIVTTGLFLLRIPYAILWGAAIALVDAVPILGTGTVMLPWALVCFLQGDSLQALGVLAIYAAAALTRSALEPRLVGRQLGLDPLLTLVCLYFGYRFWGFLGILLAPMLGAVCKELAHSP